jgi:hypothetical protein
MTNVKDSALDVAHALMRAAPALVPARGMETITCRDESRHGTHECVRHIPMEAL